MLGTYLCDVVYVYKFQFSFAIITNNLRKKPIKEVDYEIPVRKVIIYIFNRLLKENNIFLVVY